jgi:hypothetical protein
VGSGTRPVQTQLLLLLKSAATLHLKSNLILKKFNFQHYAVHGQYRERDRI